MFYIIIGNVTCICQYFSQINVVSKFKVHTSSKVVMMY
jgi:hypothetical protein